MGPMVRARHVFAAVLVGAALLSACRAGAPIYSVRDNPVPPIEPRLSQQEVGQRIVQAGVDRGWLMESLDSNTLEATLRFRRHVAAARITFSDKAYSIDYRSSVNLNERGGNIHPAYNRYIHTLESDINAALARR